MKVTGKRLISKKMLEVTLEKPTGFDFEAGQYVSFKVDEEGSRRSYSIASAPGEREILIAADITPMGKGTKYLLSREVGEMMDALGPMGRMTVKEEEKELLFIATGGGIVPFRSMIVEELVYKKSRRSIKLKWGTRHEEDLFWMDLWEELKSKYENFRFEAVLSKPVNGWKGRVGHVCDVGGETAKAEIFICGSQEVVKEISEKLVSEGAEKERIQIENFY